MLIHLGDDRRYLSFERIIALRDNMERRFIARIINMARFSKTILRRTLALKSYNCFARH